MATNIEVKEYLAKWLQIGKKISIDDVQISMPQVIRGEAYTPEFEQLWDYVQQAIATLNGTNETIQDLLKPEWEIITCAVCEMPISSLSSGYRQIKSCPCSDLSMHPNLETIAPRSPITTSIYLQNISDRLTKCANGYN
ncbi:hypothetical protein Syn7502_02936 [Synechococcus sp. PCC 7502]|uniref:hypothetical protein n=1 Tax=Synechococcus sp. PCC 7502 TaxID=1173263 RepID=UPI00029FD67E|nr:hypothetical protein [Synechococcus sp. PCC 7502]AFY74861.1 hypothetical protein Syn7502_02936 [Synechococcus sp. PCC 7502]